MAVLSPYKRGEIGVQIQSRASLVRLRTHCGLTAQYFLHFWILRPVKVVRGCTGRTVVVWTSGAGQVFALVCLEPHFFRLVGPASCSEAGLLACGLVGPV